MLDAHDLSQKNVIYALHAGDGNYRYIGKTEQKANSRFRRHKHNARHGANFYVYSWMRSAGIENVEMEIVQICEPNEISDWEGVWIHQLKEMGYRLTNLTAGGEGTSGYKASDQWKLENSIRMRGEGAPRAKLTEKQIGEVWFLLGNGFSPRDVAKAYGVTPASVYKILRQETWKYFTPGNYREVQIIQKDLEFYRRSISHK